MKHQAIAAVLTVVVIALALLAGTHRRAATIGAGIASFTALASLFAMARTSRAGDDRMKGALVVMAVAFLVRLLLVALGTWVVVAAGEDVVAFIVSFFVPYFAFSAIEAAFLHSIRRTPGPTA